MRTEARHSRPRVYPSCGAIRGDRTSCQTSRCVTIVGVTFRSLVGTARAPPHVCAEALKIAGPMKRPRHSSELGSCTALVLRGGLSRAFEWRHFSAPRRMTFSGRASHSIICMKIDTSVEAGSGLERRQALCQRLELLPHEIVFETLGEGGSGVAGSTAHHNQPAKLIGRTVWRTLPRHLSYFIVCSWCGGSGRASCTCHSQMAASDERPYAPASHNAATFPKSWRMR
jgi:hypothetical protein